MWPMLLIGCAARLAPVPIEAEHTGPLFDPPRFPLVPLWVDAEPACVHLAEALRFALSTHADQLLLRSAKTQLHITRCETSLDERVTIDPDRTAALGGVEGLDALLTGRAGLTLEIRREAELLDVLEYDVVRVEHQEWIGGERYAWHGPLTGLTERDLVEEIEVDLMVPHPALRPKTRNGNFISEMETTSRTR